MERGVKITISSPVKAFLSEYSEEELSSLKKALTYTNTAVKFLIKKHYNNHFWKSRNPTSWQEHLNGLQKDLKKTLVFEEDGKFYIRPGSIPYLTSFNLEIENQIVYPTPKKIPWLKPPKYILYPYQEEAWTKLLIEKHGNVSLCTGSGKTKTIIKLCRETGFRAAIIAPSKSIFYELIEEFNSSFGKS